MPAQASHVDCFLLIQSFETYWAYYSLSDGALFAEECKDGAMNLVMAVTNLSSRDPSILDLKSSGFAPDPAEVLDRLRTWALGETDEPYEDTIKNLFMIHGLLTGMKRALFSRTGASTFPPCSMTTDEELHRSNVVQWKPHLPSGLFRRLAFTKNIQAHIQDASSSQTIAVVADIRRSQDLMTYAASAESFSGFMLRFLDRTRQLVDSNCGIFDKFTGDGFVAYFNEAICDVAKGNYIESFMRFVRAEMEFAAALFGEWVSTIRKTPPAAIGLGIGADHGRVSFAENRLPLVAVGDAIVWASRMSSVAEAGETIVNNLLYEALKGSDDWTFVKRDGGTKAGETFSSHTMAPKPKGTG